MIADDVNLCALAQTDPEALAARLADPATPTHVLSWGAECLGARWTPDRWWPTIKALLRHRTITVREAAMVGLAGEQTEPDEPHGVAPPGFYAGRNWPADLASEIRDEVIAEMARIAADVAEHDVIRGIAVGRLAEIRSGQKYPEDAS